MVQSEESKRREQALRLADLAPLQAELDRIAALADTPRERLHTRVRELEERLAAPALSGDERTRLQREHRAVRAAARSPAGTPGLAISVLRSLSAAARSELLAEGEHRLSTEEGSLPKDAAPRIHRITAYLANQFGPLPPREAKVTLRLQEGPNRLDFGPRRSPDRHLRLEVRFGSLRGDPQEPNTWYASLRVGDRDPAPAAVTSTDDPALKRQVVLVLPGPATEPRLIAGGSFTSSARTGTVWPARAAVADVAEAIHKATGIEVIADSFVGARLDPAPLRRPQPLAGVLDTLAREVNYTWEKEGNLLRLRNRYSHRDRPAEVPARIIRPWRERVSRSGGLGLDHLADLAAALPDPRTRSMQQFWGWYVDVRTIPRPACSTCSAITCGSGPA